MYDLDSLTPQTLKEDYRTLINDPDFDRIEKELSAPNVFEILNIAQTEIRHTNFLAWLLDPNGNHALGTLFIKRFLRSVLQGEEDQELTEFDIETLNYNNVEIRREWRNIDLLIVFDDAVVTIENKIMSKDHSKQLSTYYKEVHEVFGEKIRKVFIYLTVQGDEPSEYGVDYINYSYHQLVEILFRILNLYKDNLSTKVREYISDYITNIKRQIMANDELNDIALKIYNSHRDILDFIFENKPDLAQDLKVFFERKIKNEGWVLGSQNKGYVRFLTPKLDKVIPKGKSEGWPKKESFLFELDFFWNKKKLKFKTVVSPGYDPASQLFDEILKNLPGSRAPSGKKWLAHFVIDTPFDKEKIPDRTEEEIEGMIDKLWPKVKEIVENVEKAMLARKAEIVKLK